MTSGFISQSKLKWVPGPGLASHGSLVLPSLASYLSVKCSLMKERHVPFKGNIFPVSAIHRCAALTITWRGQGEEGLRRSGCHSYNSYWITWITYNSINMYYQWGTTTVLRWPQSQRQDESSPRPTESLQVLIMEAHNPKPPTCWDHASLMTSTLTTAEESR